MTKLEEKLIELGYEKERICEYTKDFIKEQFYLMITINPYTRNKIVDNYVFQYSFTKTQQDIDNLQQAYNQLQKDLEVLKEYEK